MSDHHDSESVGGALGSVRRLEGALEAGSTAREAADARLREARSEAARVLAAAREDAASAAAERRRSVLAAAEDDAAAIHRQGEERAARVHAEAREQGDALVDAALALIVPPAREGDA